MKLIFRNRNLANLFISTFLFFSNEAIFLPTLPLHLAESGYSHSRIGIILGAFALGVMVFRPLSGMVTDRVSRRISLIIGTAVFFLCPVFYLFSTDMVYLLILRFFHGMGITFYTTASPALITDIVPDRDRGTALGHMATAPTLGFAAGPLIGAALFSAYGIAGPVAACTALGVVNLISILFIREPVKRSGPYTGTGFTGVVFRRSILVSSMAILTYAMIFGGIMTFLPLLTAQRPGLSIGLFFLIQSAFVILARLFFAGLPDARGRGPVFFYSTLLILISVYAVSTMQTLVGLIVAALLYGCGSALCTPSLAAHIADNTEANQRGTAFGFFYGAFDAGVILAGLVLGFVADLVGLATMFCITALAGALILILFSLLIQPTVSASLSWTLVGKKFTSPPQTWYRTPQQAETGRAEARGHRSTGPENINKRVPYHDR